MKSLLLASALALAGAACGGKAAPTAATNPTTPAAVFELGELEVAEGDQVGLKIHADGSTELGGSENGTFSFEPGPTLATDGRITWQGKTLTVGADGSVTAEGKTLPFTVTADAIIVTEPAGKLELAPDGTITFNGKSGDKPITVRGADTAGKRRAVLALLALTLMSPGESPPAAPSQGDAATPAN